MSELQKHIQHHCMYPHQTDTVQINALEYDPDIDGDNQPDTDKRHKTVPVQGTLNTSQESSILEDDNSIAPDNIITSQNQQETDWPDAPTIQIPGISSTTLDQPPEVTYNRCQEKINRTNKRLTVQYRMMIRAHDRYNTLFRQTHKTFQIHHLALLMFKDYITILVGTLQRIHRQYVGYESALDDTV